MTAPDPWTGLRRHTPARIALGRAGVSLPTSEWLAFGQAQAMARDAVHRPLDTEALQAAWHHDGFEVLMAHSRAADRATYLQRPDLGRRLDASSLARLQAWGDAASPTAAPRVALVVGDGLSAQAVQVQAPGLLRELRPALEAAGFALTPVVLVQQARVALGDEAGTALRAQAVVMLVGERPGMSAPDSLGAYLTWGPEVGLLDSRRNCLSNIRPPTGLGHAEAARRIAWLLGGARRLGMTGVALKDDSDGDAAALPATAGALSR